MAISYTTQLEISFEMANSLQHRRYFSFHSKETKWTDLRYLHNLTCCLCFSACFSALRKIYGYISFNKIGIYFFYTSWNSGIAISVFRDLFRDFMSQIKDFSETQAQISLPKCVKTNDRRRRHWLKGFSKSLCDKKLDFLGGLKFFKNTMTNNYIEFNLQFPVRYYGSQYLTIFGTIVQ